MDPDPEGDKERGGGVGGNEGIGDADGATYCPFGVDKMFFFLFSFFIPDLACY